MEFELEIPILRTIDKTIKVRLVNTERTFFCLLLWHILELNLIVKLTKNMKKNLPVFLLALFFCFCSNAQVVISEIMYNPPEGGTDSLEYIELYNASDSSIDLTNYSFLQGVEFLFPDTTLEAGAFFLLAKNAGAMETVFGVSATEWTDGALSNGGESIVLQDADSMEVDNVEFETGSPWPSMSDGAAGAGASIEYCLDADDNSIGENWKASTNGIGDTINSFEVKGTPGSANSATCTTAAAETVIATSNVFTPADITINVGETVLWRNDEGFHNVNGSLETYPDNPEGFGNGDAASAPWEYTFTFTEEGTYNYQCDPHVSLGMTGTVTVVNNLPSLVITEIMYNDPSDDELDSFEFVEVYNFGSADVNLGGIVFSSNVIDFTLPDSVLTAGEFLLLTKTSNSFLDTSGALIIPFLNGGLGNNSDSVILTSADGDEIDRVVYMDSGDWPLEADGQGSSLSLCDIYADNEDPANWQASQTSTGITFDGGVELKTNPGALNACSFSIAEATAIDTNGVAIKNGLPVYLEGTVYGVNIRPGGLQFTIIDGSNEGIGVFSGSENFGYELTEGDSLRLGGEIGQFNGLTQLYIDTLELISSGNTLLTGDVVTMLGEETESSLVTIEDVQLIDPSQWTGSGSGFNVDVSNGTDTFALRIDADVVDLYEAAYPSGTFSVTGIGGQFDNSEPYLSGYQLFPRYLADIDPYVPFVETYPFTSIADASAIDENGIAVMDGEQLEIIGTTYGINYRPSGLQFTIIDENNDGIGLFFNTGDLGYDFAEGDMISVRGSISQFNGLTQINPDSILFMSADNDLVSPTVVTALGEDTESQLVNIAVGTVVDPTQWAGDGSSFNVDVQTTDGTVIAMRIDSDTDLANQALPGTTLMITGIGGQFDGTEPYLEGYQLFPRYATDVVVTSSIDDVLLPAELVQIFPSPVTDVLTIEQSIEINQTIVFDVLGRRVFSKVGPTSSIDVSAFSAGQYFIHFIGSEGIVLKEFVKK